MDIVLAKKPFLQAKAIILDMDGVLVDTEPLHMQAFAIYLAQQGIEYDRSFLQSLIGYSIDENIRRINRELLRDRKIPVKQGVRDRDKIYIQLLKAAHLTPIEGIPKLVQKCLAENKKLALASSSSQEQVDIILHALAVGNPARPFDLRTYLASIITGDDVIHKKPAPDIYSKTVNSLGIPAEACLAIEDSFAGIRSAKAAGVKVVGLLNPYNDIRQAREADGFIASINDLL
ncbi:MAG TPA: HAD family phosphatase [Calditrichaeota bacterium]|nr:HAD family phosphatase [Calditrichota bacterium]